MYINFIKVHKKRKGKKKSIFSIVLFRNEKFEALWEFELESSEARWIHFESHKDNIFQLRSKIRTDHDSQPQLHPELWYKRQFWNWGLSKIVRIIVMINHVFQLVLITQRTVKFLSLVDPVKYDLLVRARRALKLVHTEKSAKKASSCPRPELSR